MNKRLRGLLVAVLTAASALPAMAVLPDSGMWSIGNELNGKPGRGIQIDRQNGTTLIVTYFGYRADGSSLFLQGAGPIDEGKTFSAELVEYRGGRVLGGGARDGERARSAGFVEITFDSSTSGTITLPEEDEPQRFTRYTFEDFRERLFRFFPVVTGASPTGFPLSSQFTFAADGNGVKITEQFASGGSCVYSGTLIAVGGGFRSAGTAACTGESATVTRYRIEDLSVDSYGVLTARLYVGTGSAVDSDPTPALRLLTGVCASSRPVFVSANRCSPDELGVTAADWKE
ncbi:MAG: hypothetical protein EOP24_42225 [Hyphomicrobiales bacterium]|nr:MAG: hypothetical protein EOP24_42225 [Hyphomicrobiales bacterium]